jgi:hypothetical protein
MTPDQPAEPATRPQRELPDGYRLAALGAAILLLAGGFVGALRTPGMLGLLGYGVSAVAATWVGIALYLATQCNRGYQSTQTTALTAGLFVVLALADAAMMTGPPATVLDVRFGVLLVTTMLALLIGAIGLFGVARGQPSRAHIRRPSQPEALARIAEIYELSEAEHAMAEGVATAEQEAKLIADALARNGDHRISWARAHYGRRGA